MADTEPTQEPTQAENLERARRYQRVLLALGRELVADRGFMGFLQRTCEQIAHATEIERSKIGRYRPREGDLLIEAGVGWKEGVVGHATMSIDVASSAGRTVRTGQITEAPNILRDMEFRPSRLHTEHGIVGLLNVPVIVDGAVWGILEVDSDKPRSFTPDTIALLQGAAQLIALAVQREQERREARNAREESAHEVGRRQILLREMQHRVKNNFQIITAMVLVMRRRAADEETKSVLSVLADRLLAMALAHEQLDPDQSSEMVELDVYLDALCRSLENLSEEIAIERSLEHVSVSVETAVAIGLILNELATNAIKHAFDGAGIINVEFRMRKWGDRTACLTVSDNGKGIHGDRREGSSGTDLIESLAAQLDGTVERESPERGGTAVRVTFPLPLSTMGAASI